MKAVVLAEVELASCSDGTQDEDSMNFSHPETIALARELVGSALYHYGADYVECSSCDAVIEEDTGSITHNLPDCKVAAIETRLDELGVEYTRPVDLRPPSSHPDWSLA